MLVRGEEARLTLTERHPHFPPGTIFAIESPLVGNLGLVGRVPLLPKSRRAILAFSHDVLMAALSFVLALYVRLGSDMLGEEPRLTLLYGVAFTGIAAGVFLVTGLYRGIWRYASLPDLFNIARAATLTGLIFLPVMFLFTRLETFPRSTLLIVWLLLIVLLGAPRLGYRVFKDRGLDHLAGARPRRQRAGAADQHQGRRRHVHPRDLARPQSGLPGDRHAVRHAVAGRQADLRRAGPRHDRFARIGGRRPRPPRPASAEAGDHRAGPRRCRGAPAVRSGGRAGHPAGPAAAADRIPPDAERFAPRGRADCDRGSARPLPGGARPRRDGPADPRQARPGDRRRRHDRLRAGPPDRGFRAGAADPGR